MSTFTNAVINQSSRTANGMKARKSTANACVDLFYNIGASRGKNIIPAFTAAYVENPVIAGRIALWSRDVRGGAGERKIFRDVLLELTKNDTDRARSLMAKVPELGRWDDLLVLIGTDLESSAFEMIKNALDAKNGLCAKWMPRQGDVAVKLRNFLGYTPKRYRKTLVELTKVVEQQMCAKEWDKITYDHVPSVAASRYQKAFTKHDPEGYQKYRDGLATGETKVNASTLYPYDVIKSLRMGDEKVSLAQWEALPNYVGDANILPMVDVSGSMHCPAGGSGSKSGTMCIDVALSLGLYLADKNKGKFKNTFLTFSHQPQLLHLKGNLVQKMYQMDGSDWGMSTNLHAAFNKVLSVAVENNVPQSEMPETILILSDMQFNQCTNYDDSAMEMIARKYTDKGYELPKIVFWNLNASYGNVPVKSNHPNVGLISGFSPAIMKSVLAAEDFTPEGIMMKTIMVDRYNY